MKQPFSDKHTIAWFKIAEYVSRGEKERALGVYRLLSHSLDDAAYAKQLEGDIFLSCNDLAAAIQRYKDAAILYQKSNRLLQAAAVHEHLLLLLDSAQQITSRYALIDLYAILANYSKLIFYVISIGELAVLQDEWDNLAQVVAKADNHVSGIHKIMLYKELVQMLVLHKNTSQSLIKKYMQEFVVASQSHKEVKALKEVQNSLKSKDSPYYALFCEMLLEVNIDID